MTMKLITEIHWGNILGELTATMDLAEDAAFADMYDTADHAEAARLFGRYFDIKWENDKLKKIKVQYETPPHVMTLDMRLVLRKAVSEIFIALIAQSGKTTEYWKEIWQLIRKVDYVGELIGALPWEDNGIVRRGEAFDGKKNVRMPLGEDEVRAELAKCLEKVREHVAARDEEIRYELSLRA